MIDSGLPASQNLNLAITSLSVPFLLVIDSGLVGPTDGSGTTRAENAPGTTTQSHISPSVLLCEDKDAFLWVPQELLISERRGKSVFICSLRIKCVMASMYFHLKRTMLSEGASCAPDKGLSTKKYEMVCTCLPPLPGADHFPLLPDR